MHRLLLPLLALSACAPRPSPPPVQPAAARAEPAGSPSCLALASMAERGPDVPHTMRVVTEGLAGPWELTLGSDGWLWLTERSGKRVTRVHPESGERRTVLELPDVHSSSGQDGLLGMALEPDAVTLAYTYDADAGPALERRTRIVRYRREDARLLEPHTLIEGLPASGDHNSGRLVLAPDGRLLYTIGDQGKNHYARKCEPNQAQRLPSAEEIARRDWSAYQGKILRLERDGSVPADNPVLAGVRSHVFSYGHRNAQGLAVTADGRIYASEHGPRTDDELNLIVAGKNYGWPHVAGRIDGRAYEYANWSAAPDCAQREYEPHQTPPSVPRQPESAFRHPDFMPPLATFYTVDSDFPFRAGSCPEREPSCWPTIAPSSLALYTRGPGSLPAWGEALLIPSLKNGNVLLVRLGSDGQPLCEPPRVLFESKNRYRDLAIGSDRRTVYVATDASGFSSGPTAKSTQSLTHRGAILAFRVTE